MSSAKAAGAAAYADAERTQGDENTGRGQLRPLEVLKVGVLALQGDVHAHTAALAAIGVAATPVRRPVELAAVDGLILPGGESTAISRLAETFELLKPLRERIAAGMPAFGCCAGMIMLAHVIADGRPDQHSLDGIDMTVRRNSFGRQVDSFETDLHVEGITDTPGGTARPLRAVFIRAPWVEEVGPGVTVLSRYQDKIVAVQQGNVLATAFHPEITDDYRVHEYFVDRIVRPAAARASGVVSS